MCDGIILARVPWPGGSCWPLKDKVMGSADGASRREAKDAPHGPAKQHSYPKP